jgi:hypothetical protein
MPAKTWGSKSLLIHQPQEQQNQASERMPEGKKWYLD